MTVFQLYALTVLIPGIGSTLCLPTTFLSIAVAALTFAQLPLYIEGATEPTKKRVFIWARNAAITLVVVATAGNLVPNERQMLLIAGGYVATNNAQIASLPTNAAKAVDAWLEAVTETAKDTKTPKSPTVQW